MIQTQESKTKSVTVMKCDKGKESEAFYYKNMLTHEFDGHGVGVWDKVDNCWKEIGCIDTETDICIGKSGGYFMQSDDIVVHTPENCRDGLRRYND